ncbi:hypothetical protein IFU20_27035 [Pseudomonas viridiflava]|nr:hypothetical protein [Pseudomonas viridiflava]MBD8189833.1 hypothetical protein [Pseudomonas viridiflava]
MPTLALLPLLPVLWVLVLLAAENKGQTTIMSKKAKLCPDSYFCYCRW